MQIEIKLDLSRRSRHLMHQLEDFEGSRAKIDSDILKDLIGIQVFSVEVASLGI